MNKHLSILDKVLLPYQKKWVMDDSRFKMGMWARQTGKSFSTACEAVMDCHLRANQLWVCLSAGERQALEWMNKCKMWSEAFSLEMSRYDILRDLAQTENTKAEIKFANGSRIIAIPANPNTARGYTANLVLDEFAIHEKAWDIWSAIYPSITNPINGDKKLRIVSTPKGLGNKFADIWYKNDVYSKHKITILDAKEQGLNIDIDALQSGVDDTDTWQQEYLCEFIDGSSCLLGYELIASAEFVNPPPDAIVAPLYLGVDVGRSHDLTAIATLAKTQEGTLYCLELEVLSSMPFRDQLDIISSKLNDRRVQRCCIDATGLGMMLAEEAQHKFGNVIEGVQYTHQVKNELFTALKRRFDDGTIKIPTDRDLREDLHSIQKKVSVGGSISYHAPRNADGHSDRTNALALAIRAAESFYKFSMPQVLHKPKNYDMLSI